MMKKMMKTVLCLSLVLVLAFSMVACGSKGPEGKYTLTSLVMNGEEVELPEDAEAYIEFSKDGTGTLATPSNTQNFEWEGSALTADDGTCYEFNMDGNTISISAEEDGAAMDMTFEK